MKNIPISKSVFDADDFAMVQEPLKSGWVVQGKYVKQFEEMFAEFIGVKHAIATTSCTTSLHIAVAALGIGAGDEVIVPSFTWISTANAVEYMGAKPVFIDIELSTFNLDIAELERLITPRTKAIIPVHLFGLPANMTAIMAIAEKHGLVVIEDAACGFDSHVDGKHVGTIGDIGCFSFHPRKSITTGEGGMITTNDDRLAEMCRTLRNHGASVSDFQKLGQAQSFLLAQYNHLGYNFRLTDIQGAVGVSQMRKATQFMAERRAIAKQYDELLASEQSWLHLPNTPANMKHGYQSYVCLFAPEIPTMDNWQRLHEQRNALMTLLEQKGVATRQGTHAPPHQEYYAQKYGIAPHDIPNAFLAEHLSLAIPIYPGMSKDDVEYVVTVLKESVSQ